MPTAFEVKLIQQMTEAKTKLTGIRVEHNNNCPVEDDTSHAPCNCGASKINSAIQGAIQDLEVKP